MRAEDVLDDEALLEALGGALLANPLPCEPSPGELAFLAGVVTDFQERGRLVPDTSTPVEARRVVPIGMARRRLNRYTPRLVAVFGAATILAGATTAAAATGAVKLPRPLRQVGYKLGVPGVESPRLSDLRHTLDSLRVARANHDPVAVQAATAELAQQYDQLDSQEKNDVLPAIAEQDPAMLAPVPAAPADTAPAAPGPTDTTPAAPAPTDTTPAPALGDTTPAAPAPTDTTPAAPAPTDTTPAAPAPTGITPA